MTAVVSAPPDSDVLPDIAFFIVRIFLRIGEMLKKPQAAALQKHTWRKFFRKSLTTGTRCLSPCPPQVGIFFATKVNNICWQRLVFFVKCFMYAGNRRDEKYEKHEK